MTKTTKKVLQIQKKTGYPIVYIVREAKKIQKNHCGSISLQEAMFKLYNVWFN